MKVIEFDFMKERKEKVKNMLKRNIPYKGQLVNSMKKVLKCLILLCTMLQLMNTTALSYNNDNRITNEQLTQIYSIAFDSFISDYEFLKGVNYIALDMKSNFFLSFSEEEKDMIMKYLEKYNKNVVNESLDSLIDKGIADKYGSLKSGEIQGILSVIQDVKIISDKKVVIEGLRYLTRLSGAGFRSTIVYKDGKWQLENRELLYVA